MIWPGRLARGLSSRTSLLVDYLLPSGDHKIARAAWGKPFERQDHSVERRSLVMAVTSYPPL